MIVGGGILQIPALKKAKELGFITYLTDGSDGCYGKPYADYFFQISTKDAEGNAKLAQTLKENGEICGVYTQGTDVEYTVAYAANKAGLPGISVEAALNCNNKLRMREKLKSNGIDHTKFAGAKTIDEFKMALSYVGFPCYVKPLDNSASRGVHRLENDENLETIFSQAMEDCVHLKEIIVEQEIPGEEYSVDTVIYKGKLYPAGISDRIFIKKNLFAVQAGSRTPSMLSKSIQDAIYELMDKTAKILGVTDGAFKGDLVVTPEGEVKIIEVTARTSGGFDSQLRKPLSFGIDILKATIDIACGLPFDPLDLVPKWTKWSSTISVFPEPGIITKIQGVDELKKLKGIKEIILLADVGDEIEIYDNCAKRKNYIISSADTLEELKSLEEKILNTLSIKTSKNEN